MAESGGAVVRGVDGEAHPARFVRQRTEFGTGDPGIPGAQKQGAPAVRVDRGRGPDPGQGAKTL